MADVTLEVTSTQINTGIKKINAINGTASEINAKLNKADREFFPSKKYVDLTLLPSGSEYIAPADGWYFLSKASSAINQYVSCYVNVIWGVNYYIPLSGKVLALTVPCKKGDSVKFNYDLGGKTSYFRFVYASEEE